MQIQLQTQARAVCRIRHDVAYDFDEERGIWLRRLESEEEIGNLITNAGRITLHTYIYGTAAQRSSALLGAEGMSYIGLSNDGTAPGAGDTALAGEVSGNGLSRAQGAVTLPVGSGTITTVVKVFTYVGVSPQAVQKTALFDAATGGHMAHEILFTQRTLNTNDTISCTFSITLT
jgi:hypothetical protein